VLKVRQVAERLNVSASKVYELVAQSEISYVRVGGAIRFEESDVRDFIESRRRGRKSAQSWQAKADPRPRLTFRR